MYTCVILTPLVLLKGTSLVHRHDSHMYAIVLEATSMLLTLLKKP